MNCRIIVAKLRLLETVYKHSEGKGETALLIKDAADAIENLDDICQHQADEIRELKNQWIPVTERLPEEEESVFVVRKFLGLKGQVPPSTYVEIANRIGDRWISDSDEYKIARNRHTDPLYWMPLPEPPKDGE